MKWLDVFRQGASWLTTADRSIKTGGSLHWGQIDPENKLSPADHTVIEVNIAAAADILRETTDLFIKAGLWDEASPSAWRSEVYGGTKKPGSSPARHAPRPTKAAENSRRVPSLADSHYGDR